MTPHLSALLLALFTTSALAQDYNRQDLVRGLCQPDGCDEFTILGADRVRTTSEGTLFKTRIQTFHASYGGRQDRGQENGYVFCSRTKPAIMAEKNGQTLAFVIAPFATEEKRESVRQNANFHALYFTICHDREAGKAAVHNLSGVAQNLGYRVALTHSKLVPLKRAEDIITPTAAAASSEPRPDGRQQFPSTDAPRHEAQALPEPAQRPDPRAVEPNQGLLAGPRRLTNRAYDTLDEMADWVLGGRPD